MRISDWSSDVCSSDLVGRLAAIRHPDMEELMNRNNSSEYRYDIDGLRAIAVTSVVIFHLFHNALSRGFLGVDIFFVISGFLISGIILKDIQKGRFTLLNFYERRIRRLMPRSEEHTSELQSLMRISYAVFCLKK